MIFFTGTVILFVSTQVVSFQGFVGFKKRHYFQYQSTFCQEDTTNIQRNYHSSCLGLKDTPRFARILDYNDDSIGSDETYEVGVDEECCSIFDDCAAPETKVAKTIAQHLNYDKDHIASLARLAVAFSPADRCLSLEDIEHVEILAVDNNHIDISAVVCESDGCVTLFVPVSFPQDCGSFGSMEECVIENISSLDVQAQDRLQQWEDHRTFSQMEETCALTSTSGLSFPSWWIHPGLEAGLVDDCKTIGLLLNEQDFATELKALAQSRLVEMNQDESYHVKKAIVVAIGPAGLYLRALVEGSLGNNHQFIGGDASTVLDVPYPFSVDAVRDSSGLRAAVLDAISNTNSWISN